MNNSFINLKRALFHDWLDINIQPLREPIHILHFTSPLVYMIRRLLLPEHSAVTATVPKIAFPLRRIWVIHRLRVHECLIPHDLPKNTANISAQKSCIFPITFAFDIVFS